MPHQRIVVDGYVPAGDHDDRSPLDNLRTGVWSFALYQRAFGPRKILVAFADCDGSFRGLAYTDRTDPAEIGFEACVQYLGAGAAAAIAFCDQPVPDGAALPGSDEQFARASRRRCPRQQTPSVTTAAGGRTLLQHAIGVPSGDVLAVASAPWASP